VKQETRGGEEKTEVGDAKKKGDRAKGTKTAAERGGGATKRAGTRLRQAEKASSGRGGGRAAHK